MSRKIYRKIWILNYLGRRHFADKGPDSQSYGFSSSIVQTWELDHKEGWAPKNWCFQTMVLEKTLQSLLDSKEIKSVNPKRNQPWIFIGRTDAEAPILWPPYVKSWLIWKDPDTGKDRGQEEKGMTEDEMVGWHHWLNGHESEQTPGDSEGQGSLVCCSPWGRRESDVTEWLNNTILFNWLHYYYHIQDKESRFQFGSDTTAMMAQSDVAAYQSISIC